MKIHSKRCFNQICHLNVLFSLSLFTDIHGSEMKKINIIDFYQMGNWLGYLRLINAGKPTADTTKYLYNAQLWLEVICKHPQNIIELKLTKPAAWDLLNIVTKLLSKLVILEIGSELQPDEVHNLNAALTRFEFILVEETRELATFYVSTKSIFSTSMLISDAEKVFQENELKRIPKNAIDDIKRAGRCIAFELPTASGFHALRALEAVTLEYLEKLNIIPKQRDLGTYINLLESNGADKNATSVIDQLGRVNTN